MAELTRLIQVKVSTRTETILKEWAAADERPVAAIVRRLIEAEIRRVQSLSGQVRSDKLATRPLPNLPWLGQQEVESPDNQN